MSTIHLEFTEKLPLVIEILKAHKVKTAYLFGSVLTDRFNEKSDLDILVNINQHYFDDYADNYFSLQDKLLFVCKRPVDIITEQSLQNKYFIESINQNKYAII